MHPAFEFRKVPLYAHSWGCLRPPNSTAREISRVVFGGLECVDQSFAYIAHLWLFRDVWIRTQRTCRDKQVHNHPFLCNLATHPFILATHPSILATHPSGLDRHPSSLYLSHLSPHLATITTHPTHIKNTYSEDWAVGVIHKSPVGSEVFETVGFRYAADYLYLVFNVQINFKGREI